MVPGSKNVQNQCTIVIIRAKKFVNITNLAREFLKNFGETPPTAQKFMTFFE